MYPSREEFTELICYISELKHQYTHKIDEQSIKINEQSMIIEELLWQIRELSDKIRQLNQWKCETEIVIKDSRRKFDEIANTCICRYENHIPKNRVVNNRSSIAPLKQQRTIDRKNDKGKNKEFIETDDDVYETIEFSDSSHIYTEPVKSDYGILRNVNVNVNAISSPAAGVHNHTQISSNKRSTTSTKMGIKKSTRTRNLQKFPAMQDVSTKGSSSDTDEVDGEVELRAKPARQQQTTNSKTKRSTSKNSGAIDIGMGFIQDHRENSESFIQQRDASGILINFDYLRQKQQNEMRDRVSF